MNLSLLYYFSIDYFLSIRAKNASIGSSTYSYLFLFSIVFTGVEGRGFDFL